jgi:acetyl-CoA carboxylase carboxyltransferase component
MESLRDGASANEQNLHKLVARVRSLEDQIRKGGGEAKIEKQHQAGVVTGIGKVEGRVAVVVANHATVKAGAWWPECTCQCRTESYPASTARGVFSTTTP